MSQGSQASILLVEPPEDDRPMYAEFLRGQGFAVTEVDSTDAGLSAAPEADLIITGIRLAGSFDGIELVRRLRGDARTKHTPVIVLTACAFEPDQARAFAAGCDLFLPKPCLPEDLLQQAEDADPPGDTASRPGPRCARARGDEIAVRQGGPRTFGRSGETQAAADEASLTKRGAPARPLAGLRPEPLCLRPNPT